MSSQLNPVESRSESESAGDYLHSPVPLEKRYDSLSMGLLFVTMVAGFPAVLVGFEWYKCGFTIVQVLVGAAVSCATLLLYTVAASYVGTASGLHFNLLVQNTFGRLGARFISMVQTILFLLWYALLAVFMAESVRGLILPNVPIAPLAAVCAVVMSLNNLFGFSGIANFARYVGAPIMICWILYVFVKATGATPHLVLEAAPKVGFAVALPTISTFIIGYSVWGNEADFWRFGKPRLGVTIFTLVAAVCAGQIVFPVCGWLIANLTHTTDPSRASDVVNAFSFGSNTWLATLVLCACYFATGDSNLYGAVNAVKGFLDVTRRVVVVGTTLFCAAIAVFLAQCPKAFEILSSYNSVILPCVTLVLASEFFWVKNHASAPVSAEVSWPALIAVLCGWFVGALSGGAIPGLESLNKGIWPVYSWVVSVVVYIILRLATRNRETGKNRVIGVSLTD